MNIRPLSKDDIQSVAKVNAYSWKKAFRGILSDKLLNDITVETMEEGWEDIITRQNRANLCAEIDNCLAGFISFNRFPLEGQIQGEIIGIYVHPDFWRLGVGKALLNSAIEKMRDRQFTQVYLWTMTENKISRSFYEKEKFTLSPENRVSERNGEKFEEVKYEKYI